MNLFDRALATYVIFICKICGSYLLLQLKRVNSINFEQKGGKSRCPDSKNKVAVITGSGMGLGQAMALLFSREGAKIVVPDINTEAGEETVDAIRKEGGDAIFVRADVSKGEDAERMISAAVESYGGVDVLV